jgi:hypothetical protein
VFGIGKSKLLSKSLNLLTFTTENAGQALTALLYR